ncbi:MAG: hypothetical protein EI684_07000 [Candidatus Viridilinea halotolerans]|uniref:Phosphorylated adapter RNA export protein n=1 Tax=Candidatus Viridilinea halotolerans TaxID=2491704 RepID=A0A426U3M5_9CHLR|nr:MAG: hypothetical protein EI684_07000 [Candidatus Viridilinea halotolerans]
MADAPTNSPALSPPKDHVTGETVSVADAPTNPPPASSPPKYRVIGQTTGIVIVFYEDHGFIFTPDFGPVVVPLNALPEGRTRLDLGQYVSARIYKGRHGLYAGRVRILAQQWRRLIGNRRHGSTFTPDFIAAMIADRLDETEGERSLVVWRIVAHIGVKRAWAVLKETLQIEAQGGMPTEDGTRQRTLGGIFFFLIKEQIGRTNFYLIKKGKKPVLPPVQAEAAPAQVPAASQSILWATRGESIKLARDNVGKAHTVKVTIIGRPESVIERGSTVMLMMSYVGPLPPLPKGIPVPKELPKTTYVVYVAAKQWKKVAEAIKDPEDNLIIEGYQIWDAEYDAIAVYTTAITTKLQQRAKKQGPADQADQAKHA